jgi:homoserine kinase
MRARSSGYVISVPASSANLGPGFDAVAAALNLRISARVEPSRTFTLSFEREGEAPTHAGLERAIRRAMLCIDDRLPKVRVIVRNAIPLGKGLGSSAAASVLGLAIAWRAQRERFDARQIAQLASALEQHPDNALASVFGGIVVAGSPNAKSYVRLRCIDSVRPLMVVPQIELSTKQARSLLPQRYPRGDVIFTAQRAALLGAALASGDVRTIGEAMRDRVHQPYRAVVIPGMSEALQVRARGLVGVALSGAGPSLIALIRSHAPWRSIAKRIAAYFERAGVESQTLALEFSSAGVLWKYV